MNEPAGQRSRLDSNRELCERLTGWLVAARGGSAQRNPTIESTRDAQVLTITNARNCC